MAGDHIQKELFDEFNGRQDASRKMRQGGPRRTSVTVSTDKLVFIGIGVVMTTVVIFAIGVEKGRHLAPVAIAAEKTADSRTAVSDERLPGSEPVIARRPQRAVQQSEASAESTVQQQVSDRRYTIQVATFRRKESAADAVARLKKEGHTSYTAQKDGFYQVCVGTYRMRSEADGDLVKLRGRYADCFIKTK